MRAAAKAAGVPVLLRVDSEEALRAYEGSDGVAYEISRLFSVSIFFVPSNVFVPPVDLIRRARPRTGRRSSAVGDGVVVA